MRNSNNKEGEGEGGGGSEKGGTCLEPKRGLAGAAHTGGCTGENEITGLQSHELME